MLRCLNSSENLAESCSDITLIETRRDRIKWQLPQFHHHHHQNQSYFSGNGFDGGFSSLQVPNSEGLMMMNNGGGSGCSGLGEVAANAGSVQPDPVWENAWPELSKVDLPSIGFGPSGFNATSAISRTSSCPPSVTASASATAATLMEKMRWTSGRDSFKKRKYEKPQIPKAAVAENEKNKKNKTSGEEVGESKVPTTDNNNSNNDKNRETSAESSKENSKTCEVQNEKPDYIHVRARRGQATDSHSLAERVRREKISERMKYLQGLVPGCNKITGKAGMLDEIINYVQSLQRQVEFLSMKLAAVNPTIDFNIDHLFTKEVFPACAPTSFPAIDMTMTPNPAAYLHQFGPTQHVASCSGLDMGIINPPDLGLRRTISAPVSLPHQTFLDSSCFNQIMSFPTCEGDLPNLYNVTFDQSFPSQPFTGLIEASNLKMEM